MKWIHTTHWDPDRDQISPYNSPWDPDLAGWWNERVGSRRKPHWAWPSCPTRQTSRSYSSWSVTGSYDIAGGTCYQPDSSSIQRAGFSSHADGQNINRQKIWKIAMTKWQKLFIKNFKKFIKIDVLFAKIYLTFYNWYDKFILLKDLIMLWTHVMNNFSYCWLLIFTITFRELHIGTMPIRDLEKRLKKII